MTIITSDSILFDQSCYSLYDLVSTLLTCRMFADDDEFFVEDDDVIVVNEQEFNLRPRLARNLPHRRSTRYI